VFGENEGERGRRGLGREGREIMKNVVLNNGVEMPILGFGVYQIPDPEGV
jgi:hypothetical protein